MVYSRLERQLPMMNQKFEIKKNITIIIDELSSIIKVLDSHELVKILINWE